MVVVTTYALYTDGWHKVHVDRYESVEAAERYAEIASSAYVKVELDY
jgi:hypothetical protein